MIKNLTPHDVVILGDEKRVISPSGAPARFEQKTMGIGKIENVPVSKTVYGEVENLPEEADGVFYIVSQLIKNALPERKDLLVPAEVVRDEKGNIVGCRSLGM